MTIRQWAAILVVASFSRGDWSCLAQVNDFTDPSKDTGIVTSVCELVAEPQRFAGKIVTFEAQYRSDGRHLEALVDARCWGGIVPYEHTNPDIGSEFLKAIRQGCLGTVDKNINAVWTGTYLWEPRNTPETGKVPRGLIVKKIERLRVEAVPNSPKCDWWSK